MWTVTLVTAMVAAIWMPSTVRADSIRLISYRDYINHYITLEGKIPLTLLDDASRERMVWIRCRLKFPDKQVPVGPCRLQGRAPDFSVRPPLDIFPWSEEYRNELLRRPSPEMVRESIKLVTNGTLSTVEELVDKVNANLENLDTFSDAELTLLATNFFETEPGLNGPMECPSPHSEGWPEDLLVSEREQRALISAFLFVISDDDFLSRRVCEAQQYAENLQQEHETYQREQAAFVQNLKDTGHLFLLNVAKLDANVLAPEEEWLWRYDSLVAAHRAMVYTEVSRVGHYRDWEAVTDQLVSIALKSAGQALVNNIPLDEPGWNAYWSWKEDQIESDYPWLSTDVHQRILYRRWKMLTLEERAPYVAIPPCA